MTTEEKALAMVREEDALGLLNFDAAIAVLCRAIEQHEAFRQEVSDALEAAQASWVNPIEQYQRFISAAPKPDPLVEILSELNWITAEAGFRAALEARGLEIRSKANEQ